MTTLFLDLESYCETPITHGTAKYSETAEIMIVTYAFDDGPVETLEFPARGDIEELVMFADEVVIHNSFFDRTVIRHALGIDIPTSKIFDTMACALSHSLPGALGTLCAVMGVSADEAKDKSGRELIHRFCKPQPKNAKVRRRTKATHPAEWAQFLKYAGSDILAMRALYKKLPRWNYDMGKPEHALWQLDQAINDRGVAVDQTLATAAVAAVKTAKDILADRVQEMTRGDVMAATQRDAMLAHILKEYDITLPDMQKGTLERRIADESLPEPVRELLRIRLQASTTSTSKYQSLLNGVSADGRLRGTLQYCGAARTGRWAGRLFQPQNLPRTPDAYTPERQELEIAAFTGGYAEIAIENIIEAAQNAVRGCMVASEGKKLVVADLANIEGRVLAWLAGETWKLQAFRDYDAKTGPDLYKVTAGRILNKAASEVTKDERQSSGKVPELACGYQGAAGAFASMAQLYGLILSKDEVVRIVKQWRKAHPATVKFWYGMEDAARNAVNNQGQVFSFGRIDFRREGAWLRMRLPSGRVLCYPSPRIEDCKSPCPKCNGDGKLILNEGTEQEETVKCSKCNGSGNVWRSQLTYMGINQYTRKWDRIKTYGGKLCIAEGTLVCTDLGWTPIEDVTVLHRVWDGVEFVSHDGLARNGVMGVISAHGVEMTPDHEVLTTEGWVCASQSERYNRPPCRLPNRRELRGKQWPEVDLEREVRLRRLDPDRGERAYEAGETRYTRLLRLQTSPVYRRETHHTRQDEPPAVLGVALDGRPLHAADAPVLGKLRRARRYGLPTVVVVHDVLGRRVPDVSGGPDVGSTRQQRGLQPGEFPVGHVENAGPQQEEQPRDKYAGGNDVGVRSSRVVGDRGNHVALPGGERLPNIQDVRSAGLHKPVYDIVNCGHRKRFVVLGARGEIVIVHNCENATQATARDVIACGMRAAEDVGFEMLLSVHDENITEVSKDSNLNSGVLCECLTGAHGHLEWTKGLPLAAAGFDSERYRK